MTRGWSRRAEAGTAEVTGPSSAALTASDLDDPTASTSRCAAWPMVAMPWVIAWDGAWSGPSKYRALSALVAAASRTTLVRDSKEDPGSLNARWPLRPIPRI